MNRIKIGIGSFAAGAALMYFFDPSRGKRRRAGVRDQAKGTWNDFTGELDKARRDAFNRTQGLVAGMRSVFSAEPDDSVLVERVRSRIGRAVSHPHAIAAQIENGGVILKGPILASEVEYLLHAVRSVSGVKNVQNRLDPHEEAGDTSSLQGGVPRESRIELMQQSWTPSLRVFGAALGGTLFAYGLGKRGAVGPATSGVGAALLARSIANREFHELVGVGCGPHLIRLEKDLHIDAPIEKVFAFWSNYQDFPRFMTHLKEVRDLGDGRSRWVAHGPAGIPVSWEAIVTQKTENQLVAWRSLPGSVVNTEGMVRFERTPDGGTRVGIRLCYSPPGGMLGHVIASLFGVNPKQEIDDDMVRLKSLIELGKTHAHGHRVTREELTPAGAHNR
jgi:uncharacterized membrane protein